MKEANKVQNDRNDTNDDVQKTENPQENSSRLHIIKCIENKKELINFGLNQNDQTQIQQLMNSKPSKKALVIYNVLTIIFSIISLSTLIQNNKYYKKIKDNLNSNTDKSYTKYG